MKKIVLLSIMCCFWGGASAESMQFVTRLSSPVGTFSQLEAVNEELDSLSVPLANFGSQKSPSGTVNINKYIVYFKKLLLKNGTALQGDAAEVRIGSSADSQNGFVLWAHSTLSGKRLIARNVLFPESQRPKYNQVKDTLYSRDFTVKGAKTKTLSVSGKIEISTQGSGDTMEWSNIYARDYSCKSDGTCTESGPTYTSYLLKSKRVCDTTASNKCTSSGGTFSQLDCACACPSGKELKDGECISAGFKVKEIKVRSYTQFREIEPGEPVYGSITVPVFRNEYYFKEGSTVYGNNKICTGGYGLRGGISRTVKDCSDYGSPEEMCQLCDSAYSECTYSCSWEYEDLIYRQQPPMALEGCSPSTCLGPFLSDGNAYTSVNFVPRMYPKGCAIGYISEEYPAYACVKE